MGERKRRCSGFKLACRGCRLVMTVLTDPDEAEARIIEFARDHRSHYSVAVDEHGFGVEPFGVQYSRKREE